MTIKICKPDCNCGCHSSGYPQEVIETCERCYLTE
jgi:hypothetical protein